MRIAIVGLWHLGTVMSGVLAGAGHDVVAVDETVTIAGLRRGELPVAEPGLRELIAQETARGSLRFADDPAALADREIVWFAYDTPVGDDGRADVESVVARIVAALAHVEDSALCVVSSQLPVGSIAQLERRARDAGYDRLRFACIPENLRLGKSIAYLRAIDRFVAGVRSDADADAIRAALAPLTTNVEIVSVESAEMTKHALNAFLATSVAFINELAGLCELVGADAREVERGLKTDMRIGKLAYVRAGGPYAGGTLARDVAFVIDKEREYGLEPRFFEGVRSANDYHGSWIERRFTATVGDPKGKRVALLGLVYKPGTDTLRASVALAFARWVVAHGGTVAGYDPAIASSRPELDGIVEVRPSAAAALEGADAAFLTTEWPEFKDLTASAFLDAMREPVVFDPGRFLADPIQNDGRLRYFAIGVGERN